ncbi:unnamed protein product [Amoebophrya sp. A25]|nr:unnamed protein product [Amoebophrya sp. A25]|eukprot:GSA25T00016793001.1
MIIRNYMSLQFWAVLRSVESTRVPLYALNGVRDASSTAQRLQGEQDASAVQEDGQNFFAELGHAGELLRSREGRKRFANLWKEHQNIVKNENSITRTNKKDPDVPSSAIELEGVEGVKRDHDFGGNYLTALDSVTQLAAASRAHFAKAVEHGSKASALLSELGVKEDQDDEDSAISYRTVVEHLQEGVDDKVGKAAAYQHTAEHVASGIIRDDLVRDLAGGGDQSASTAKQIEFYLGHAPGAKYDPHKEDSKALKALRERQLLAQEERGNNDQHAQDLIEDKLNAMRRDHGARTDSNLESASSHFTPSEPKFGTGDEA